MLGIEQLPLGPLMTNCYIVWDEDSKKGVIIDPGDQAGKVMARVKALELDIDRIFATHCHFDHIGAVAELRRDLDAAFIIHKEDLSFARDCRAAGARWGFRVEQPDDPDGYVEEGEEIEIGKYRLEVLHTPGHSPGGISLFFNGEEDNVTGFVFVGDCLFQRSIGRTDFRQGSMRVLEESIRKKLYTLPDETVAYTGHGPPTTIGEEKKYNPFVRP